MPQTVAYRLTIRNASTVANPDGTADELVLTSDPVGTNPYIAAPPSGDGAEVDPLTGAVRTGAYVVEVVDADTGTDATGTIRVVTNKLEDATFRQQLLSRRAYVDVIRAGVSSRLVAGYISSVRLVSPMRYAITVGDTRRVERTQTIFQGAALGSYTTRGCLTGGPVTADFGTVKARGGWRYLVSKSGDDVTLTFVDGYEPGAGSPIVKDWRQVNRSEIADVIEGYRQPNPYAIGGGSAFVTSYTTPVFDFTSGDWIVAGGMQAVVGSTATNGAAVRALVCGYSEVPANEALGVSNVYLYWPSCPYSNGATVYVSLTTVDVNETCPLYLDAHPVDLVTAIWTNARVQYSASAAATVKTLIGDTVRLACRFPQAPLMDEFLQQAIYGPFGISERTNSSGEQELFPTRIKTDVLPTLTVNAAAMRGADEVVFDLDEQTAVSGIRLTQQMLSPKGYAPGTQTQNGTNTGTQTSGPLDGIVVSEVTQTAQYLDPNLAVFAGRVVEYKIPGMIHTAADFVPNTTGQLDAIAIGTFDRFGRGCQSSEVSVLATAGAAAAQIGDEVYFEAPHFPNKGYRIGESTVGARIMQVVRRTETPAGPVFRLLDSGLAAQPVSPPATITVAQNPNAAATTARFTITNAATINSGGVLQVRVEWATGTTTPTGNGADFAFYAAGKVPTGPIDLPPVTTPGQTVYVRARTEQAGRRPSAWTAWASVALANIPTVSSLTSSNLKQTAVTLSWTNGSSTLPLLVFAYQGGSAPANWSPYRIGTLPAGTTSTVVRNLSGPSIAWTVGVAYETAQAVGAVTSTTVTTNSTLDTPTRPAGLAIIPGVDDATLTQGIALALWGSDQTLDIQIQRSTTSGSGFATIATVSGATTVYVDQLPRTGTTYYYKIAHVLGGFTTSTYTPEVSGTAAGVPVNVTRPGAVMPVVQVETSETATTGTVTLTITDTQNRVAQVRFRERTNGGAWSAWTVDTTVPYSYTGTLPSSGFLDIEYEVTGFDAAGTASQVLAGGIESFDTNTTPDMVSVVGSFTQTGGFVLAISADSDTASIKYAISTTSQPNLATVQGQTAVNARTYSVTLAGPYAVGTTVYVSVLGYTAINGGGDESALFEYRFTRDGGLVYTECVATAGGSTATQIVVTVTGTAPVGTPTVELVAVTGSATLASGPAIGVASPSGQSWTFNRGAALGQPGGAQFRSVLSGAVSDDDFIEIPEQGRDTTYLASRARVIATSDSSVTVRYAVLDKYTALSSTITYLTDGIATITPASPQTVTTAVGDTFTTPEAAGSYVDFVITRPVPGAPTGRVTFTATATGRVADSDAVDVPAQPQQALTISGSFSNAGALTLTLTGDQAVQSIRYALSTASQPNLATVQGQTAVNSRNIAATFAGPYANGQTVYVSALAYTAINGGGLESALFETRFTRDGGLTYTQCIATALGTSTATAMNIMVTGTAPVGTPTVQLVAVTGSATQTGGPAVGVASPSGSVYNFLRGAALGPTGGAIFRSVLSGAVSDDDFIEIPEQGRDTTYLTTRARVFSTSATQIVVRVAVLDKYSALTSTVSYQTQGIPAITPSSPQTVTTAVGDTFPAEVVGEYLDFTVDRPAFGAGTGRVVFTATATGRVADTDSVDIPAIERDTIALTSRARITTQTSAIMVVRYAVATPVALSPNTASIAWVTTGIPSVSPGTPQTITPETNTTITEAAGSYVDFTVDRPAVGSNPGRIAFLGTATGRTATSDSVDVPPQERIGPSLKIVTTPGASSYSLVITWDGTIVYNLDGVSQSVSGWTSPRTETITRGDIGANTKVAAFAVTKDNVTVSESINIPPLDITSASLSIGTQTADDTTETYEFDWTASGFPTGTTYDLNYRTVTTGGDVEEGYFTGLTVTNQDVVSGFNIGANPTYQMTVSAIKNDAVLMSRSRTGTFLT